MSGILTLMNGLLNDRIAVVTGGAGGIGAATARLFADQGAQVVIADIDAELAQLTAEQITASGGSAFAAVTDVRDAGQVAELARSVLERHGRVDVLVNNVGHWLRHPGNFVDTDPQLWDDLYRVNLHHVFLVTHAFLPAMIGRRSGAIVNVSSVEGLRGYPEDPVYAAFKAAVIHFTRSLAVQVGRDGVRVNAIGPDVTESLQVPYSQWLSAEEQAQWPQWVPVGRMGLPEDQAQVILFLASDLSAFVTGHTIPTDGGTGAAGGWFRSSRRPDREWTNRPVAP
jgi:NAD(P)-dependent dehydrogenase (short-subunit alcohol dehydrogenase family)